MSNHFNSILQKANNLSDIYSANNWFTQIAEYLLNSFYLIVESELHRLAEIEFYCYAQQHPDLFTHRDSLQLNYGRWYFHRNGGQYKGGSFKGLDLTFGDSIFYGGILIRSLELPDGRLICGPSLCVDYLLEKTNALSVANLDNIITNRLAWDSDNIISLQSTPEGKNNKIFRTARVGLSLKKATIENGMISYILRPYRYLTEPLKINKGKPYLVLALHLLDTSIEEINQLTGCPKHIITKYIADFDTGYLGNDFSSYFGLDLNTKQLCKLHGTWHKNFSS
ncbi:MAG: hypothetical protein KME64_18375 [Scytonematopsis contorta HA4267-MV1]|jgi:hypothetical protein|nr:hypothetical protein [Scytonematopsis contorta HA4267-MV1]